MSAQERIAEALAVHNRHDRWNGSFHDAACWGCTWGTAGVYSMDERDELFAAHQAAVIANLPDIAVVELPTPVVRPDLYDRPQNDYLNWGRTIMYAKPEGIVYRGIPYRGPYEISSQSGASGQSFSMASARQYAAALLACADEAERLSDGHESFRDIEHREAQARAAGGGS